MRAKEIVEKYFYEGFPIENIDVVLTMLISYSKIEVMTLKEAYPEDVAKVFAKWNQKWLDICYTEKGGHLLHDAFKNGLRPNIKEDFQDNLHILLGWWPDEDRESE